MLWVRLCPKLWVLGSLHLQFFMAGKCLLHGGLRQQTPAHFRNTWPSLAPWVDTKVLSKIKVFFWSYCSWLLVFPNLLLYIQKLSFEWISWSTGFRLFQIDFPTRSKPQSSRKTIPLPSSMEELAFHPHDETMSDTYATSTGVLPRNCRIFSYGSRF